MANQAKLVNKQFNSPIGLYSPQNIQEVIERESQILSNGAVGINFQNPGVGKPANLKNSAVLRMLEEEENRQRNGFGPGAKRVTWPPPNDSGLGSPYSENSSVSAQGGPQYSPSGVQQNNYQAPSAQQQAVNPNIQSRTPLKPLDVTQRGASPLNSPVPNQTPQGFKPHSPSKGWAPVHSPSGNPSQPSWQQAPGTHFQSAHQSVTQQNYLGQQYQPSGETQYQPQQYQSPKPQQYQAPSQQYQTPPQSYQAPSQQYQAPTQQYQAPPQQYQAPTQQYQAPAHQYQAPPQQYQAPPQQYQAPPQQYQAPPQQYQAPSQQYQAPPQQYQSLSQQHTSSPQQYQTSSHQSYSSVQEYSTPQKQYQTSSQTQKVQTSYQVSSQQYQTSSSQQYQSPSIQQQQSYQQVPPQFTPKVESAPPQVASKPQTKPFEPPPATITLRSQPPVSQAPPPVFNSQPATATLKVKVSQKNLRGDQKWPPEDVKKKMIEEAENICTSNSFLSIQGGKHLRGDLKWPPEECKKQAEEENRLRLELAKGPAFRPRRPNKDYTDFFAQHALNSTYPGYKIPPGTQFFRAE